MIHCKQRSSCEQPKREKVCVKILARKRIREEEDLWEGGNREDPGRI
jgi:hypothetical protein